MHVHTLFHTHTHTHTHTHWGSYWLMLRNVTLKSKWAFFGAWWDVSFSLSASERQTQSSHVCVWFIFLRRLRVLFFSFFSQPPHRRLVKWNAQQLGTYASSWDTNGFKSNLSRIWARLREGPTHRCRQTNWQRVETKRTGELGVVYQIVWKCLEFNNTRSLTFFISCDWLVSKRVAVNHPQYFVIQIII